MLELGIWWCGLLIGTFFFAGKTEPKCKLIDSSQLRPILNGDILKSVGSHYAIVGPNEFSLFHMGPQLLDVQLCNFNSNSIWRGLVADGCFCFFLFQWLRPAKQFSNSKFTLLVFTAVHDGQLGCLDRCCCCCCLGKTKDLEYLQGATRNRYSERERETLVLHKLCCCIYSALVETLFRVPLKPAILCGNCAWYTTLVASKNCPFAIFQGASWLQIYLHTQFSTREDRFFPPRWFWPRELP